MKKLIIATSLFATGSAAMAGPMLMVGISHNFGGGTGFTIKLMSTNQEDKTAAAVGITYFPGATDRRWGADVGVGHNFRNAAVTVGYDWLNRQWQVSAGVANTSRPDDPAATIPEAPGDNTGDLGPVQF